MGKTNIRAEIGNLFILAQIERMRKAAADSTRQDVTATALDQAAQTAQLVNDSTRPLTGQKRGER